VLRETDEINISFFLKTDSFDHSVDHVYAALIHSYHNSSAGAYVFAKHSHLQRFLVSGNPDLVSEVQTVLCRSQL